MRAMVLIGLATLLIGLLPVHALAQMSQSQGRWSGTARVDAPGCGADVSLDGEVRGSQLRGQGQFFGPASQFEWAITADGNVFGGGMQGRINGNRLVGTWQRLNGGRACSYRVEMIRR
jgi:hypothetical protein